MSDAALIPGYAELPDDAGDCECCEGIAPATPEPVANRPGLSAVAYRPGRFADFRKSQLARLSDDARPALAGLKSRDDDDFTIALIDAWSCVCDVLSFYQERHANEAFLGTASERSSIVELGRLIGYRLRPGVAAATDLVLLLDEPPGAAPWVAKVAIPAALRVQSVPGPDEDAQTFETVEAIEARVAWNALKPRQSRFAAPKNGDVGMWLEGVGTGLTVGDAIVILGDERAVEDFGSEQWDFRKLVEVAADPAAGRTFVAWTPPLGSVDPPGEAAHSGHRAFAFRTQASLFGWNAPHPILLSEKARGRYGFDEKDHDDWSFEIDEEHRRIHLDRIDARFVAGGWIALTRPQEMVELYKIVAAVDDGRADYAVSARVTRLTLDTDEGLDWFGSGYRKVSVYGGSEELGLAETPILEPVMGDEVELAGLVEGLVKGRRLVMRGRRAQAIALADGLELVSPDDPALKSPAPRGTRLTLLAAPKPVSPGAADRIWRLRAPGGFEGLATAPLAALRYVAADAEAERVAEVATLDAVALADETHALLRFSSRLAGAFDRPTTVVHANVAAATHGETTQEVLGDGAAGRAFQSFRLKQGPLTYVSAATETGAASTLVVRVGDVGWREAPTLYGEGPAARAFETRIEDDGAAIVQFGDGVRGARPPTGRNNLVATYRKGIGAAGSVGAGKLTTLLDKPLGLREAFNPLAAAGGQDPETLDAARLNAPITTLTLGRVVSLRNYADFARGFAGVSRARADAIFDGEERRIVVTVAGPGGEPVDPSLGDVFDNLVGALRSLGDPFVRVTVVSFRPAFFRLKARVMTAPDYEREAALKALEESLRRIFGFETRGFAPSVSASEVIAAMHAVPGVLAVDLDRLHRVSGPGSQPILHSRLLANPVTVAGGAALGAEILTLDERPLEISAMS